MSNHPAIPTPAELDVMQARCDAATHATQVGYDGPSRPMVIGDIDTMLSISRFDDGRWVSYDNEDNDCWFYAAARTDLPRLIAALREAREGLIEIERQASMSRIWGGMGWRYNPLPEFRIKRILGRARRLLGEEE